jgi:hypothetical protein
VPYKFKDRIQEILEHLLLRDLPDLQKRKFWKRFPPENKLKVFLGAIHNNSLNREVVGDWDVRTVSELFSYLPLVRETSMPMLIPPFYSPEQAFTIFRKKNQNITKNEFVEKFKTGLEAQLKDSNAIVIASPDVNPVCEFLLNAIYQVSSSYRDYLPVTPFTECKEPEYNGYFLVKERKTEEKVQRESDGDTKQEQFPRLFSKEKIVSADHIQRRGFVQHHGTNEGREFFEPYYAQDEKIQPNINQDKKHEEVKNENENTPDHQQERGFSLVGQLLIAKYPPEVNGNFIILLNGVSGPATYALAQILTGGVLDSPNGEFAVLSEEMLKDINWRLDERPDIIGVQGLVKVNIVFDDQHLNMDSNVNVDIRKVKSWEWIKGYPESIFPRKIFPKKR